MLILVTGGAASGKSQIAEAICTHFADSAYYVATMKPYGKEAKDRIARHLKLREGKGFITVEQYTGIGDLVDQFQGDMDSLLIECMANLCANELYSPEGAGENTAKSVICDVKKLMRHYTNIVVVTNEVFSDGIQYDGETMRYMKILGEINRELSVIADVVLEAFYGIPLVLKDAHGVNSRISEWIGKKKGKRE